MNRFYKATPDMIDRVHSIYKACIDSMDSNGILQWDEGYPNRDTVVNAIKRDDLFCFEADGSLAGSVILNDLQAPEYSEILWSGEEGRFLVIHTLVVHPDYQGKGFSKEILKFSERYALDHGFTGIRLDAFSGNPAALHLYESNGYVCRGAVYFSYKKSPYKWYNCYDKIFRQK